MATTVNARDLALAATSPRITPVTLPANVAVDYSDNVTGSTKPANNATVNRVTRAGTAPASPVDGDIWIDTSVTPNVVKTRIGGAWISSANYTTNTNQLTDGAGLGTTATWASVSGTGKPSSYADVTTTILAASGTSIVMTNARCQGARCIAHEAAEGVGSGRVRKSLYRRSETCGIARHAFCDAHVIKISGKRVRPSVALHAQPRRCAWAVHRVCPDRRAGDRYPITVNG